MTMTNKDKLINRVITQFQKNRGKSSFYCFTKDVVPKIIKEVIEQKVTIQPDGLTGYPGEGLEIVYDPVTYSSGISSAKPSHTSSPVSQL